MRTSLNVKRPIASLGVLAVVALTGLGVPSRAQAPALAMLDGLDKGLWNLRVRGSTEPDRKICLGDPRTFIQLQHTGLACERVIVSDRADEVTVQYTCRGKGYGRTHIRRESGSLIQIDSQGIADGAPYAFAAEARRIGTCRG